MITRSPRRSAARASDWRDPEGASGVRPTSAGPQLTAGSGGRTAARGAGGCRRALPLSLTVQPLQVADVKAKIEETQGEDFPAASLNVIYQGKVRADAPGRPMVAPDSWFSTADRHMQLFLLRCPTSSLDSHQLFMAQCCSIRPSPLMLSHLRPCSGRCELMTSQPSCPHPHPPPTMRANMPPPSVADSEGRHHSEGQQCD